MLNSADENFTAELKKLLPEASVRAPQDSFLEEPRGKFLGRAACVVSPENVEQVSTTIRAANAARVGVVPYGGGTGLVGGQVQPNGPVPILLSLHKMARIRTVLPDENVLVAEAGATLAEIHQAAEDVNRLFPLSYASQGTASIGGGLSVNSGGLNVLRYGTARALCLGVEAVLPDGSIHHGLKRLHKDNTGYDLRNLLIGAEGTLGVITAASLTLAPRPARTGTAFLIVKSPSAALTLLGNLRTQVGEAVSAFELIAGQGLAMLADTHPETRQPFETPPEWSVLIELGMGATEDPDDHLFTLFETGLAEGLVTDGVIAQSDTQRADFWAVRETIPDANKRTGAIASHDVSLPLGVISNFITRGNEAISKFGPLRINAFGHLGDGNLHYNMFAPKGQKRAEFSHLAENITRAVHDLVVEMGGSFSAEHGIGRLKVAELERYGDPAKLNAMRAIKSALDPNGIMNPGAVLKETADV